jgi:hypothetical protein
LTARTKLKTTQAEIATLTAEIARLEAAKSTAREQATEAQTELAAHEKLDNIVAKWRASEVKAGRDPRQLPGELKKKLAAKKAALEELAQSRDTLDALTDELGEAKTKLRPLLEKAEQLALDTLHDERIAPMAEELIALKDRALQLELFLTTFPASSPLIAKALASYRYDFADDPKLPMSVRWRIRIDALKRDGSAAASAPKLVTPADFAGREDSGYRYPQWRDEGGNVVVLPR